MACIVGLSRPSHFLLSGQEKVTKEKATPEARPPDSCPPGREVGPGFSDGTSMYRGKLAHLLCATLRALSVPTSLAPQGPREERALPARRSRIKNSIKSNGKS